jgi:hypothetical protein
MIHKMASVRMNQVANMKTRKRVEKTPASAALAGKAPSRVMLYRTSESWAWARERAQSRRYEAVLEMQPGKSDESARQHMRRIW